MNEQQVREFEENIVKGANLAFQRLVSQKKKESLKRMMELNLALTTKEIQSITIMLHSKKIK